MNQGFYSIPDGDFMGYSLPKVQAKINGDRVSCGKCGALLAIVSMVGTGGIEIKCKHKSQGKTCNTLNEVQL